MSFRDRLPLLAAVAVSGLWIAVVVLYVRSLGAHLHELSVTEAAGLLAGAGGPPAAFWLFMAVIEQRSRLVVLTQAMGDMMRQHRHTLQLAETQTRALVEFQGQAKRSRASETRQLALQDLATQVAVLADRLGVIRGENLDVAWARFGSGDMTAFVQPFLNFAASHPDMGARLGEAIARDQIAATALHGYVRRYDGLTAATSDDRMVQEIIDEGALGRAYRLFKTAVDASNAAPAAEVAPEPATENASDDLVARLTNLSERLDASAHKAIMPGV
jgi:hypothetical protein